MIAWLAVAASQSARALALSAGKARAIRARRRMDAAALPLNLNGLRFMVACARASLRVGPMRMVVVGLFYALVARARLHENRSAATHS